MVSSSSSAKHNVPNEPTQRRLLSSNRASRAAVFIREENEVSAMNGLRRCKTRFENYIRRICCCCRIDDGVPSHKKNEDLSENKDASAVSRDSFDDEAMQEEETAVQLASRLRQYRQYRFEAIRQVKNSVQNRICAILTCFVGTQTEFGVNSAQSSLLARSLHWCFRVNIFVLFIIMSVFYFGLLLIFGGLIVAAGVSDPQCVYVGSNEFGTFGARFYDAFSLSWSTMGSVGYGSVYPSLSNQHNDRTSCAFITATTSFETLVGIIYSGFCGAMLFAKVLRVQSHAQVIFSDPIVIRYGPGVNDDDDDPRGANPYHGNKDDLLHRGSIGTRKKIPLPVLEFRIVNRNSDQPGGEIIDAKLNIVATLDAKDTDPSIRDAVNPEKRWKRAATMLMSSVRRFSNHPLDETATESTENIPSSAASLDQYPDSSHSSDYKRQSSVEDDKEELGDSSEARFLDPYASLHGGPLGWDDDDGKQQRFGFQLPRFCQRDTGGWLGNDPLRQIGRGNFSMQSILHDHRAIDEDPESQLVTKRIFSKLRLESSDHPFFKRVWLVRHVLDEHSPLLKPRVRRLIQRNEGHWPADLNSHNGVRSSVTFNQILVSFRGVSNVSAARVYAQKIYQWADLSVGYQFASLFFMDAEGDVQVDHDLINDVREQDGGGGEPLYLDFDF